MTIICQHCGRPFEMRHPNGIIPKYCSQRCRTAANALRRATGLTDGIECTCVQCGRTFLWEPSKYRKVPPMYCTKRCGVIASHQSESYTAYQASYYQEHKEKWKRPGSPRVKLTPEERREHLRTYQREYKRKLRAKQKEQLNGQ